MGAVRCAAHDGLPASDAPPSVCPAAAPPPPPVVRADSQPLLRAVGRGDPVLLLMLLRVPGYTRLARLAPPPVPTALPRGLLRSVGGGDGWASTAREMSSADPFVCSLPSTPLRPSSHPRRSNPLPLLLPPPGHRRRQREAASATAAAAAAAPASSHSTGSDPLRLRCRDRNGRGWGACGEGVHDRAVQSRCNCQQGVWGLQDLPPSPSPGYTLPQRAVQRQAGSDSTSSQRIALPQSSQPDQPSSPAGDPLKEHSLAAAAPPQPRQPVPLRKGCAQRPAHVAPACRPAGTDTGGRAEGHRWLDG